MERDELGREVRHRPPPGYREPELDDTAWPDPEHSRYTFEGQMDQYGTLARGMARGGRRPAVRIAGFVVVAAMLVPIVVGAISIALHALNG